MVAAPAIAQTTVVLDAPNTEIVDAFIRAGSYANTVHNNAVLVTKSNANESYLRRALLKFDTHNRVPANATIASATLTLTLRRSESDTRTLAAYRVATSFDETAATWYRRKDSAGWSRAGGDLGSRYDTTTVGTTPGTRVTFDLTTLVQEVVRGNYGSRYTRIALVDTGSSSSRSYKEFHSSEASDPSVRPQLRVVYGGSSSSATSDPEPDPEPEPALTAAATSGGTTVVLDRPNTEIVDTFIRAGTYANTTHNSSVLVTKANANPSYTRRALVKFDTHNTVPANATISSATLTLTLRRSESETRTIGAYRVASSFDEGAATWYRRSSGSRWTSAGGDLGSRYDTTSVGTTPGTRVTFNVRNLVQEVVRGNYGSRYTRIALVDAGSSSSRSYKEFYSSEASDPSVRPQLRVVYGGTSTSSPTPEPEPEPAPAPAPTTTSTLKVLHWNIHYGFGTDGRYDIERQADWIARINPDVVSLNEVEKYVSGHGNEDQPRRFAELLRARTGRTWYYHHVQRFCGCVSNGGGNLILSRFPIQARSQLAMSYDRSAALATIEVNGRTINIVSTHLASESSSYRATQARQLVSWLTGFSEQRIVAGDFNSGLAYVSSMEATYNDGWTAAQALGTAQDYPGNYREGSTFTNGYKIDFIFHSEGASRLRVRSARVYDTRDANGRMASDHKPLMLTYSVN